ncbi:MAG: tetratricopeptide repeat protein [Spirochaetaceae bacterium]
MERNRLRNRLIRLGAAAGLLAALLLLSSCGTETHLRVLRANYAFGQGRFQNATVDYLRAFETGEYGRWIAYNLGNVYYALGEVQAALGMWERAGDSDEADILFGVAFNKGVYYYERGRYRDAYTQFQRALEIDPGNVDAKVNLELALRKIRAGEQVVRGEPPEDGGEAEGNSAQTVRILEYVRRKEENRWFAADDVEDEPEMPAW